MPGFSILPNDDWALSLIAHSLSGEWGVKVQIFRNTARWTSRVAPLLRCLLAGAGLGVIAGGLTLVASPAAARHHPGYHGHARHGFYGVDPSPQEALAFATLANEFLFGNAGNVTGATGAPLTVISTPPRQWGHHAPPNIYPDPDVIVIDPSFAALRVGNNAIHSIATGFTWALP